MNPRQRRGALLLAVTAVGAITVFVAVVAFVGNINSKVGPMAKVLELKQAVDAYEPVEPDMLEVTEVPQRWLPGTALTSTAEAEGLVAASALPKGALLQQGMLVQRPGLQPGYREVAIVVDAETGVAGKVSPGDHVDIIATIKGTDTTPDRSEVWVSNALVLEVGVPQSTKSNDSSGNFTTNEGVPVTFALRSQDALRLAYAESFSVKLRLALRGAGDDQVLPDDQLTFQG